MSPKLDTTAHKPRNKLRKPSKFRPVSMISNSSPKVLTDTRRGHSEECERELPQNRVSLQSSPTDLSDPRWGEFTRKSGYLLPMEKSPQLKQVRSRSPADLIPEFAHLAVNETRSSRNSSFEGSMSSKSSTSSTSLRRYAKTPVLRIGQLEGYPGPRPAAPLLLRRSMRGSNVEQIAEQYRALLDSKSCEMLRRDEEEVDWQHTETRQDSMETIRSAIARRVPQPQPLIIKQRQESPVESEPDPESSPTSDGTLVGFEEDAIYFKPAFTPEALSPIPEDGSTPFFTPLDSPRPRSNAVSLQICIDLLSRELMSAARQRDGSQEEEGGGSEVPSLQTWLMIEAYEKLRDQVLDMQLSPEEMYTMETMLDTWLKALYVIHDEVAHGKKEA